MLTDLVFRLRAIVRRARMESELDEELRNHIDREIARLIEAGVSRDDAIHRARLAFGGLDQIKEACRDARGVTLIETTAQDLRYAARVLRRQPGFAAVAVLSVALGTGVNTAIFSIVHAVLLKPLPYANADRLVAVWEQNLQRGWTHNIVSAANFLDWRQQNHVFADMAAAGPATFNLGGAGEAIEISGEQVTSNWFSVLGVQPVLGRSFLPEDGNPTAPRVALLGYGLWKRVYAAEAEVVGRQIFLNGNDFTVVGIMPAGLADLSVSYLGTQAEVWTNGLGPRATTRTDHAYVAIARLRPGVSLSQAQTEMDGIAKNIERAYPENKGMGVGMMTLHDDIVGNARPPLLVLQVAALFVVLVTSINLASLLLARGAMRQPELAIRAAVGAGRGRLMTQLLVESLLLATVGGTLGLVLAQWGVHVLTSAAPANMPGLASAGLNLQVLAYSAAVAVAGGLIFGCIPAMTLSKDVQQALKGGGRTASGDVGGYRVRGVFVACEFALALMLVIGASLMIRTLVLMGRANLGFDPDRVVTMRVPLRGPQYRDPARQAQFFQQLLGRVEALPGVESASVSRGLPVVGWAGMDFVTEDRPQPPLGEAPDANYVVVGPHYFQTMKIPLLQGRAFADSDAQDRLPVVIVNDALVREQWPGQNALGKKLRMGLTGRSPWLTVVGVVSDVFSQFPQTRARPELYMPYTQYPWALAPRHLIVRTKTTEANVSPAIARLVADLDKDQPVADVRSMQDVAAVPMAQRRFLMQLLVVFAALALTLASLGVYGLISYAVAQRTREIGIRLALGAARLDVLRVVMSREMTVVATGLCVGLAGALALTRFLAKLLYQIAPTDPWTFTIVPLTLLVVAAMATYLPARHATEIDPLAALRYE